MYLRLPFLLSLLLPLTSSLPSPSPPPPSPYQQLTTFPPGTWVENLAIRSPTAILATLVSSPSLYQTSPQNTYPPILIATFPNATSALGIVSPADNDIFYVIAGRFDLKTFKNTPGSYSVYQVDMRPFAYNARTNSITHPARTRLFATFPDATFLNGATAALNAHSILLADSGAGAVWKLNTRTAAITQAIPPGDPLLAPVPGKVPQNGINGLRVLDRTLYFTNSNQEIFASLPLYRNGSAAGKAKILYSDVAGDDFAIDNQGKNAYVAVNSGDEILRLGLTGAIGGEGGDRSVVVAKGEGLAGPTSARFGGRGGGGRELYVSSNGGVGQYVTGNFTRGGGVGVVRI
ncbi:MAG: hypothetical protein Q9220_004736 [cf. Caloplaca sp. 1 TL-2023]